MTFGSRIRRVETARNLKAQAFEHGAGENLVKLGQPSSALMSRFLTRGLFMGFPSFT